MAETTTAFNSFADELDSNTKRFPTIQPQNGRQIRPVRPIKTSVNTPKVVGVREPQPSLPISHDNWSEYGLCKDDYPDAMFVTGVAQNRAKKRCLGCKALNFCLYEALDNQIEWGVWGGMTERERRALLRRNVDWRPGLLEAIAADQKHN